MTRFSFDTNQKTAIRQLKELEKLGRVKTMRLAAEGWGNEWKTLLAILMSARTRDETTIRVAQKLFAGYKTASALGKARQEDVAVILRPVNFFRNKTKNVIGAARALTKHFGGRVPHDISQLVTIPGVGRKTANVFLSEFGHDAIGVDTHVSYISQKLRWTKHSNPHKIEKDLEELFLRRT